MNEEIGSLLDLRGRHVMVTGAATGIGEGIARTLAAAGAAVSVIDIAVAGGWTLV